MAWRGGVLKASNADPPSRAASQHEAICVAGRADPGTLSQDRATQDKHAVHRRAPGEIDNVGKMFPKRDRGGADHIAVIGQVPYCSSACARLCPKCVGDDFVCRTTRAVRIHV
jgi:hypothetical protein